MTRLSSFTHSRFNSGAWAVVMLIIIEALSAFLSGNLTVGKLTPNEDFLPTQVLYRLWLVIVIIVLVITVILWLVNDRRRLRLAIFVTNSLLTEQLFIATLLLIVRWLQSVKINAQGGPMHPLCAVLWDHPSLRTAGLSPSASILTD